jgi:predicted small lipoprotein YifL
MRTSIALLVVSFALAACGFKGPLYLPPGAKPAQATPNASASTSTAQPKPEASTPASVKP